MTKLIQKSKRIESIDILRGIVMILMCLDHTRDYYHNLDAAGWPMDLETTTPGLFFTRYITHFCAPIFVLLSGTSIYLQSLRKSKKELSIFLFKRGMWLIFLEIVLNNFLWKFDIFYDVIVLQVIWAIGASMVAMAIIIQFNKYVIFAIGAVIVLCHNLLDSIVTEGAGILSFGWLLFHQSGVLEYGNYGKIFVGYPMLPWLGIMILGFVLGWLYNKKIEQSKRIKVLIGIGLASLITFCILRLFNLYGDPNWAFEMQKGFFNNLVSFIRITKYPPSLHYSLVTIGVALLLLAALEQLRGKVADFFLVFGKVPLFFYFLHIAVIHLSSMFLKPFWNDVMYSSVGNYENSVNNHHMFLGVDLIYVYLAWVLIITILYIPCKRYMQYKGRNRDKKWLSYF